MLSAPLCYLLMPDCIGENPDLCPASLELKVAKELDTGWSLEEGLSLLSLIRPEIWSMNPSATKRAENKVRNRKWPAKNSLRSKINAGTIQNNTS